MAKQTFTVGQVLTAAQVTSLQQTAMGGGAASAKTASYTLVAADAGTTISMTSTSATTITVNTGLFAAGDTVFIQNLGSGNLTVTAGTATVSTAGSAILPTNDAGILYFVSTGVSIFYDFIQVGAASPLTTKGDLYTFSTSDTRIGVGANGTTLVADSSEATGLKWQAPASAGFVGCSITNTNTSVSIANATNVKVAMNSQTFDTDGFHDNATNNTRITIPAGKAGKYLLHGSTFFSANATGERSAYIFKNNTEVKATFGVPNATANCNVFITTVLNLAVADYVEFVIRQSSGGALNAQFETGQYGWFDATYLGA